MKGQVIAQLAAAHHSRAVDAACRAAIRHAAAAGRAAAAAALHHAHTASSSSSVGGEEEEQEGGPAAAISTEKSRKDAVRVALERELDAAAAGEDGESGAAPVASVRPAHLPTPTLLQPPSPRRHEYVPLSKEEVEAQLDVGRLWHADQAHARRMLAELRHGLRDGLLLVLGPGLSWRQHSHAVLLHGALLPGGGGEARGPQVLPWAGGWAVGGGGPLPAAHHRHGLAYHAGPGGAVLVVCPEHQSADSDAGSEPPTPGRRGPEPCLVPSPFAAAEAAAVAAGCEAREAAKPLHRVRSRRLPLSSQLAGMETAAPP